MRITEINRVGSWQSTYRTLVERYRAHGLRGWWRNYQGCFAFAH